MQDFEFPSRQMPKFVGFTPSINADKLEAAPETLVSDYASAVSGILAAIEYMDGHGDLSRRRVSMRRLTLHWDHPVLYAICMECDGLRCFRLDRLQCFITHDGEVLEPADYWDQLGINPHAECLGHVQANDRALILGPYLNVLCALADSDGERHRLEVEQIMDALEVALEGRGEFLNEDELRWLRRRVENTFPARQTVNESLEEIFGLKKAGFAPKPQPGFMRLALSNMRSIAEADGKLAPEEVRFFQKLEGLVAEQEQTSLTC